MLGYWGEVELIGQFAIFSSVVILFTQIAGLEIHQTIARSLHVLNSEEKKSVIKIQSLAILLSYAVLMTMISIFYTDLITEHWILGGFILIGEHLSTEIYRYNIIMLRPIKASILLFLKNFGWVACFLILYINNLIEISIKNIFILWAIFILVGVVYGAGNFVIYLKNIIENKEKNLTLKILKTIWEGKNFIISAIAIGLIASIDKILMVNYFNNEELGKYFLSQSIATVPALVVGMTIGVTIWPKCIKLAACEQEEEFAKLWKKMQIYYGLTLVGISLLICMAFPIIMGVIDKKYETNDVKLLLVLLVGSIFYIMCEPYKLKLYTSKHDVSLVMGNLIQLILVVASILIVYSRGDLLILGFSIMCAHLISVIMYKYEVPKKINKYFIQ
jgi:O-antigen/teichoic acid export membrane protein